MAQVDFSYLQDQLQADALVRDQVRDAVRDLEHAQRASLAVLSRVHSHSEQHLPALLASLDPTLPPVRAALANLARLIPPGQFYRYSDSFTRSLQQAAYIVVLRRFLEEHDVPSKAQVAHQLAIDDAWADHFFLSTEDYLHSLISLVNELSRLAINRVTLGDYAAPVEYSRFAKELSNAFGLLNLKNDSLRKRFDSIKYDVKRLEEVVYDLSLRGLLPPSSPPSAPTSTPNSNSAGAPAPAPAPTATGAATGAAAAVDDGAARPVKKQRTEEDGERAMAVEP